MHAPTDGDLLVRTPGLVARDREVQSVVAHLAARPSTALIEGEAGIGKSRFLAEVLRRTEASRDTVLVGHCQPLIHPLPLSPVIDALRALRLPSGRPLPPSTGALRPVLPELVDRLPPDPGRLGDPAAEQHRLFRAIFDLFDAAGPAVLCIEDLHWADDVTLDFLHAAVNLLPSGCALVVTTRDDDTARTPAIRSYLSRVVSAPGTLVIGLRPLDRDQVAQMIEQLLDTSGVSPEFAAHLCDRTAGIPFAVEEVVRLLVEQGSISKGDGRWTRDPIENLSIPWALRESILARVSNLSSDAQSIVRACAILRRSDEATLAHVTRKGPQTFVRGLSEALGAAIVTASGDVYQLRHVLIEEAVYGSMPEPMRRDLHRRAASALTRGGGDASADLVRHLRDSGNRRAFARAAKGAGEAALRLGDCRTAFRLLSEALDAGVASNERLSCITLLADAALSGHLHADGCHRLQQVSEDENELRSTRGAARIFLGWLLMQDGRSEAGFEQLRAGVQQAPRNVHAVIALGSLASPRWDGSTASDHDYWLQRARTLATRRANPVLELTIDVDAAHLLLSQGKPEGWALIENLPFDTQERPLRQSVIRGAMNLILDAFALGEMDLARRLLDYCEQSVETWPGVFVRFEPMIAIHRLLLRWSQGTWDGLAGDASRAIEEASSLPWIRTVAECVKADVDAACSPADVRPALIAAVEAAHASGSAFPSFLGASLLGRMHLDLGATDAARHVIAVEWDVVRRKDMWASGAALAPLLVESLVRLGRPDEAAATTDELASGLKARISPAADAYLVLCKARMSEEVGSPAKAAEQYGEAAVQFGAIERIHDSLRATEQAGRCLAQTQEDAGELFRALEGYVALGAVRDERRVRALLREHGIKLPYPWRGGRQSYGAELSPREREVASLAAEGLTNREIAKHLYLSEKTVERHVSAVLRKLAVSSRRELAGAVG